MKSLYVYLKNLKLTLRMPNNGAGNVAKQKESGRIKQAEINSANK